MCSNNICNPQDNPQEKINTIKNNIEKQLRKQWIIKYCEAKDNKSYNKNREIDTIIYSISKNHKKRSEWMTNYIYN
jgi:hypothetical protein